MARVKAELSAGARLVDYLTVGFLALNCPLEKVREVLIAHDTQGGRQRGLPHEVLVYFVMARVLYAHVAYEEVLRLVYKDRRHQTDGTLVRLIEYTLEDMANPEPSYRLIPHWLDRDAAPAVSWPRFIIGAGASNRA